MLVVKCCLCGTVIRFKEENKIGIEVTHTYCDLCFNKLKQEITSIDEKQEITDEDEKDK